VSQSPAAAPNALERASIRGDTVTTEDGGRLNAFATEPRMEVVSPECGWGFHDRAEKLNGRMAMLGFIALLATEFALGGEAFIRGLLGLGEVLDSSFKANHNHWSPVQDSLPLSGQFAIESHSRVIDSCTELEDLREVAKSLLNAW